MWKTLILVCLILPAAALAQDRIPEGSGAITVTNKPPPPGTAAQTHAAAVQTPKSTGRPHTCTQDYPKAAIAANEEGVTTLSFLVSAQGTVEDASVAKSSGYADLDAASVVCVNGWTYTPATQNGKPFDTRWMAAVTWSLHDDLADY